MSLAIEPPVYIFEILQEIYTYWTSFIGANVFLLVTITLFQFFLSNEDYGTNERSYMKKKMFGVKTGFPLNFLNSTRDLHLLDQFYWY